MEETPLPNKSDTSLCRMCADSANRVCSKCHAKSVASPPIGGRSFYSPASPFKRTCFPPALVCSLRTSSPSARRFAAPCPTLARRLPAATTKRGGSLVPQSALPAEVSNASGGYRQQLHIPAFILAEWGRCRRSVSSTRLFLVLSVLTCRSLS